MLRIVLVLLVLALPAASTAGKICVSDATHEGSYDSNLDGANAGTDALTAVSCLARVQGAG